MHRNIGILGGISPESTVIYYRYIIREYFKRYRNLQYPQIIVYSVSYEEFCGWLREERWDLVIQKTADCLRALQKAGADFALIACNTVHIVFEEIQKRSSIPLISIVDATAEAIEQEHMKTVGLLGTMLTMNRSLYEKSLKAKGISILVPKKKDQQVVDEVICEELASGKFESESKERFVRIVRQLAAEGAEGIILGCTEIPLILNERDCGIRLFNTAEIHAEQALNYATNAMPSSLEDDDAKPEF